MSFRDDLNASRRLALLRLVQEGHGSNESILFRSLINLGFRRTTREETRADIKWLRDRDLVSIEMLNDTLMVPAITDRGRDAAAGRGERIEGLEYPE